MSDIVERLREFKPIRFEGGEWVALNICTEAADEIQSLRQRVERLEEALRDIVDRSHNDPLGTSKVIDMRKLAVAALSPKVQEGE